MSKSFFFYFLAFLGKSLNICILRTTRKQLISTDYKKNSDKVKLAHSNHMGVIKTWNKIQSAFFVFGKAI